MSARIMVVDDEEVTGRLLLYQLQSFGYESVYLQDGLQALQRVLIEQPDLILLDVMMPHISGWEVCREIRACSSVPIIMLTAKDADDDIVAGLGAGADDYVTKPFNMAQLHARIEAVLRRSGQREVWGAAVSVSSGSGRRVAAITPPLGTPALAAQAVPRAVAPAAPAQDRRRDDQALRVAAPAPELVAMPQPSTPTAQPQRTVMPVATPAPAAPAPAVRQRIRLALPG
jgi:DNA-binding response OmpR family regulator